MEKFKLGKTVMTAGVAAYIEDNAIDLSQVSLILSKHLNGDWGNLEEEDKEANDYAIDHDERILSKYKLGSKEVYIITEWDRSYTTILLVEEY